MIGSELDLALGIFNLGSNPGENPRLELGNKLPGDFLNFVVVDHASKDKSAHSSDQCALSFADS